MWILSVLITNIPLTRFVVVFLCVGVDKNVESTASGMILTHIEKLVRIKSIVRKLILHKSNHIR